MICLLTTIFLLLIPEWAVIWYFLFLNVNIGCLGKRDILCDHKFASKLISFSLFWLLCLNVSGIWRWNNALILQVPASTHYSMVFYFVTKELVPGSLLQRFVDGDDEFRNSRLKLIPSVPKVFVSFSVQHEYSNLYTLNSIALLLGIAFYTEFYCTPLGDCLY